MKRGRPSGPPKGPRLPVRRAVHWWPCVGARTDTLATADRQASGCADGGLPPWPQPYIRMCDVAISFAVSRDEEHVQVEVAVGGERFDLGARSRHYLLLTLARRRLEDAAAGLPETACGWIAQDELSRDPTMAGTQLNVNVFRLRRQFERLGVLDPTNIVERRPTAKQVRIGTGRISIIRV